MNANGCTLGTNKHVFIKHVCVTLIMCEMVIISRQGNGYSTNIVSKTVYKIQHEVLGEVDIQLNNCCVYPKRWI